MKKIEQIPIGKSKRLMNETEDPTAITLQDDDEKWDCETILTIYSNTYNHMKLITQIPLNKIRLSKKPVYHSLMRIKSASKKQTLKKIMKDRFQKKER